MTKEATSGELLVAKAAADRLVSDWDRIGMGKVKLDVHDPYLKVSRAGADWVMFVPVVPTDAGAVMVLQDGATTRHVPKELRPDTGIPDDRRSLLAQAFGSPSGGSYPVDGGAEYAVAFRDGDGHKELRIGITTDTFEVVDA